MQTANRLIQQKSGPTIPLGPIWLLVATSSIIFIEPSPYDLLAMFLCIAYFAIGLRIPPSMGTALFLVGIYVLSNFLSAMFSLDPSRSLGYMAVSIYLVVTWLFFTSIIYYDPKRSFDIIWNGYILAALIAAILGILAYYTLIPWSEQMMHIYGFRVRATFKHPNVFGAFLVPVALYLTFSLENAVRSRIVITLAFLAIVVLALFLSFSRGAWGSFAVSGFLYMCMRLVTSHSKADAYRVVSIAAVVFIFCIVIAVSAMSNKSTANLFSQRAELQTYDVGSKGRFGIQRIVLYDSFLNPIGFGPAQSLDKYAEPPHSLYIHILAETGWLGAIAFCSFLLLTLWRSFFFCLHNSNLQGSYIVVFVCVVSMLLEGFVIHSIHWRHMYLLLAMVWGPMVGKRNVAYKKVCQINIQ